MCIVWIRAELPLAVTIFFTGRGVVRSFSNGLFQIEYLRVVLIQTLPGESPRTFLEVLC